MPADKHFFDTVRGLFGGRLTQGQVEGMSKIVDYGDKWGYSKGDLAYVLATTFHETAQWMQPIREGARRYGLKYSDRAARAAVAQIYAKGIIRTNYALPAGPYRQSYYGRGLTQITWYDNYKKFTDKLGVPLDKNPDLALEWDNALDIMFLGMRDGMFRGDKLSDFEFPRDFDKARNIINGDTKKYGNTIAGYARVFYMALGG